jgi:hypothetical protein
MVVIMTWVKARLSNGIDFIAALRCEGSAFEKQWRGVGCMEEPGFQLHGGLFQPAVHSVLRRNETSGSGPFD